MAVSKVRSPSAKRRLGFSILERLIWHFITLVYVRVWHTVCKCVCVENIPACALPDYRAITAPITAFIYTTSSIKMPSRKLSQGGTPCRGYDVMALSAGTKLHEFTAVADRQPLCPGWQAARWHLNGTDKASIVWVLKSARVVFGKYDLLFLCRTSFVTTTGFSERGCYPLQSDKRYLTVENSYSEQVDTKLHKYKDNLWAKHFHLGIQWRERQTAHVTLKGTRPTWTSSL